MRTFVALALAAGFASVLAGPAMADCTADITKVEADVMKVSDATQKTKAEKELTEAKDAAKKNDETKCMESLAAAKKTAGVK